MNVYEGPHITIGPPVSGEDFFDREELMENLWETLQSHSVLLAAPRRVGKSSIMLKIHREPRDGFESIWLDGQNYDGPEDLVADLVVKAGQLRGSLSDLAGKFLGKLAAIEEMELWQVKLKLRQQLPGSWRVQGETAIREILRPNTRLLIVIDELPMLLHKLVSNSAGKGRQEAQELLDWLRHLRQAPGLLDQVRQILGGSIGLPRIASLLGSSQKINDLRPIGIGAFERPKARELATALFRSRNVVLEEQVMDAFLNQIGTLVPIFIHILASVVATEVQARDQPATAELIRQCYEERALGPEYRTCFEDYYERLDRYYSPEEARAAKVLLRELAIAKDPVPKSTLLGVYHTVLGPTADAGKFDLLLTWLSDDFYVREAGEGLLHFWSSWMRDWWRTYHGSKP